MMDAFNSLSIVPIDPKSIPFKTLNSYILPAYDTYHTRAKERFHTV